MNDLDEIFQNQQLELRRGTLVLAILSVLNSSKHYGYSLLKELGELAFPIESSTLYPLLRRLEKQKVLESEWDTTDARPRKYYRLTIDGAELYQKLLSEWVTMTQKLSHITKEKK